MRRVSDFMDGELLAVDRFHLLSLMLDVVRLGDVQKQRRRIQQIDRRHRPRPAPGLVAALTLFTRPIAFALTLVLLSILALFAVTRASRCARSCASFGPI